MKPKKWAVLFLFLSLAMAASGAVRAEEEELLPIADPMSIYIFPEHLNDANAEILSPNGESRRGIWESDQFQFFGLDETSKIKTVSGTSLSGESAWQAIQMNTIPKRIRKLQFLNVPPGQTLVVYYRVQPPAVELPPAVPAAVKKEARVDKASKEPPQNMYFYFNIYAGKTLLRRLRVSSRDLAWKREVMDLKIIGLLNRNYPLTFAVTGSEATSHAFQFSSEIYQ